MAGVIQAISEPTFLLSEVEALDWVSNLEGTGDKGKKNIHEGRSCNRVYVTKEHSSEKDKEERSLRYQENRWVQTGEWCLKRCIFIDSRVPEYRGTKTNSDQVRERRKNELKK